MEFNVKNRAVAKNATAQLGLGEQKEKFMERKITAPQMFALEHNYLSIGQKCILNDESAGLLNTLLDKLAKLQWNNETERWRFWVSVPRGTIEDFDYADLHEREEYETDEEYEKAWKEWFPNEEYWYEITVAAANGYAVIVVNIYLLNKTKDDFIKINED